MVDFNFHKCSCFSFWFDDFSQYLSCNISNFRQVLFRFRTLIPFCNCLFQIVGPTSPLVFARFRAYLLSKVVFIL